MHIISGGAGISDSHIIKFISMSRKLLVLSQIIGTLVVHACRCRIFGFTVDQRPNITETGTAFFAFETRHMSVLGVRTFGVIFNVSLRRIIGSGIGPNPLTLTLGNAASP